MKTDSFVRRLRRFTDLKVGRYVLLAALAFAGTASAQTIPHVTGTFKTPEGKTPTAAGLKAIATIASVSVYGTVDFQPLDAAAKTPTRIRCGGVTYLPLPVRVWIKGDGTAIDGSGAAGTNLVSPAGCDPATAVYRAVIQLAGTADGRIATVSWTEDKTLPAVASVDWGAL